MQFETDLLLNYWKQSKIQIAPPATTIQIEEFETLNQMNLPHDFKSYLLAANGFQNWDSDNSFISFWPIEKFEVVVNDKNPMEAYLIFADFLINSHYYAIKLRPPESADLGSIWVIGGQHFIKLESTFQDFIHLYLTPYQKDFGNKVLEFKL